MFSSFVPACGEVEENPFGVGEWRIPTKAMDPLSLPVRFLLFVSPVPSSASDSGPSSLRRIFTSIEPCL